MHWILLGSELAGGNRRHKRPMIPADGAAQASLQTGKIVEGATINSWKKESMMKPKMMALLQERTEFAEDLLLLVTRGEEDFGVEALGLEGLPGRALGPGFVPGINVNVQIDLEQVWVLLLNVAGIQIIPGREAIVSSKRRPRLSGSISTVQTKYELCELDSGRVSGDETGVELDLKHLHGRHLIVTGEFTL